MALIAKICLPDLKDDTYRLLNIDPDYVVEMESNRFLD